MGQVVQTEGPRSTRARPLRPTDLVALAAFEARAFRSEARTCDRLHRAHRRPLAIATVLEQWIAAEDRHTLVVPSGLGIRGLISARHRSGRAAWEVDWLVLAPEDEDDEGAALALLDGIAEEAIRAQVQRIFLRLPKESPLAGVARRTGFVLYGSEVLLKGSADHPSGHVPSLELRPRRKSDELGIFRLYHGAVPAQVRSMEGMTLEEWRATREVRFWQQREYVWDIEGRIRGWLQVNRGGAAGQLRLLLLPEDEDRMADLLALALGHLLRKREVLALVPHFQPGLRTLLQEVWSYEEVAAYQNLARQLAVRVPEARLVPARA